MNDHRGIDWLLITILAFTAGVVNNILVPARRGAWGFLAAAIVGMFCGCTFGFASHLFEAPMGLTIMITSVSGVLGDRVLMAILQSRMTQQNISINGNGYVGGNHTDINGNVGGDANFVDGDQIRGNQNNA
ncbi:phage holin family protein [Roseiconus lacunae]|uniref:phage holin family protein n=1 Tax=Roseiconus lacunae TaxID=2605694 RepID=UPI001E4FCCD2|nr:phage holin family protein [Roseiconus lacunae]MCD0459130.1 phage holin family protein [Roseiconus lacunae]